MEPVGKGFAFNAFHYEELDAVMRSYVVQRADVGVIQTRDGLGLALKAFLQNWILGESWRKNFDGNRTIQTGVSSTVDFAHAARTERRKDLVRAEFGASVQCHKGALYAPIPLLAGADLTGEHHSWCRAVMGSTRVARRAGMYVANMATAMMAIGTMR